MARRQHTSEIPLGGVAPLSLLIEAATTPDLFKAYIQGSKLEVAEGLDALDRGAVLLPLLMHTWAIYEGHVALRSGLGTKGRHTVAPTGFHETLGAIGVVFPLEYSTPLPPRGKGGAIPDERWGGWTYQRMRVRRSDRLQIIGRTEFFEISVGQPEDVDDEAIDKAVEEAKASGNLPYFEEPSLRVGRGKSIGHVWVRITPAVVRLYRQDPVTLFELIARLRAGRIALLRDRIARTRPPLRRRELEAMNAYLATEAFVHDAFASAALRTRSRSRKAGQQILARAAKVVAGRGRAPQRTRQQIVFISYAHADRRHQQAVQQQLAVLEREGHVKVWWDECIPAGGRWERHIATALNRASVVVLLVSRHFLSSKYCYDKELAAALKRADRGRTTVIPAILSPCRWLRTPLAALKAVPRDGKEVVSFPVKDQGYLQIAEAVEAAVAVHGGKRLEGK